MLVSFLNNDSYFDTYIRIKDKNLYQECTIKPEEPVHKPEEPIQRPAKKQKVDEVIVLDSDEEMENKTDSPSTPIRPTVIESIPDSPEPPRIPSMSQRPVEEPPCVGPPKATERTQEEPPHAFVRPQKNLSMRGGNGRQHASPNTVTAKPGPNRQHLAEDYENVMTPQDKENESYKERLVQVLGGKPVNGNPEFRIKWLKDDKEEWISVERLKNLDSLALLDYFLENMLFETKKRKRTL